MWTNGLPFTALLQFANGENMGMVLVSPQKKYKELMGETTGMGLVGPQKKYKELMGETMGMGGQSTEEVQGVNGGYHGYGLVRSTRS